MAKKVLIISYYFPPQLSVGAQRAARFAKQLVKHDVEPLILSVANPLNQFDPTDSGSVVPHENCHYVKQWNVTRYWQIPTAIILRVSKLFGMANIDGHFISNYFRIIDAWWGWVIPAYYRAKELIKKHDIKTIIISCPPFSSSLIGLLLKNKLDINLILDLRDIWFCSETDYIKKKKYACDWARKVIAISDKLVVNTPSALAYYAKLFSADKLSLIPNGYDEMLAKQSIYAPIAKQDQPMTIVYAGSFGTAGRTPDTVFAALSKCTFEWRFLYIGEEQAMVSSVADEYNIRDKVKCLASVPKQELIAYYQQADVLFSVQGKAYDSEWCPYIAAKEYDHIIMGKPILAEMPAGDNKDFLLNYAGYTRISEPGDVDGLFAGLQQIHDSLISGNCTVTPKNGFKDKFSPVNLTAKLSELVL